MNRFFILVFVVASAIAQECPQTCAPQPVIIQLSCNGEGGSQEVPATPAEPPHHEEEVAPEPESPPAEEEHGAPAEPPHHEEEVAPEPEAPPAEEEHIAPAEPPHHEEEVAPEPEAPPAEEEHGAPAEPPHHEEEVAPEPESPPAEEEHIAPAEPPHHKEETAPAAPPAEEMEAYEQMDNICEFDYQGIPITHPPGGWPSGFRMTTGPNGEPKPVQDPFSDDVLPTPPSNWDGSVENLGFPMPARGTAHFNMLMCWPIASPSVGSAAPAGY